MKPKGIVNIVRNRIEIMGPPPPEVIMVRTRLARKDKEIIDSLPDDVLESIIATWLWEEGYSYE
jgi:hypothetical protein